MRRRHVETAPWTSLDTVQFTLNHSVLVLLVRAGATFPGKTRVLKRPSPLPFYALGTPFQHRRRDEDFAQIVAAVERFAPGTYTDEPFQTRKAQRTAATGHTP